MCSRSILRADAAGAALRGEAGEQPAGRSAAGGTGRYRLQGNTLVREYEGGESRRFSVFPFGDDAESASPEFLNVGGRMLARQEA